MIVLLHRILGSVLMSCFLFQASAKDAEGAIFKAYNRKSSSIITASAKDISFANFETDKMKSLSIGYQLLDFSESLGHSFDVGINFRESAAFYGYGATTSICGLITNGKFTAGPKVSVEGRIFVVAARLDLSYLYPYVNIAPYIGLSLFDYAGLYVGYNNCINKSDYSGFSIYLNVNVGTRWFDPESY